MEATDLGVDVSDLGAEANEHDIPDPAESLPDTDPEATTHDIPEEGR